jgi:putative ATPase
MACAPKSNAGYVAINQMRAWVADHPSDEVPLHLRNAPTKLMKQEGYGAGYHYAHDFPDAFVPGEKYLPEGVEVPSYQPVARGLEMQIAEKLAKLRMLNEQSEWRRYEQDKKTRS